MLSFRKPSTPWIRAGQGGLVVGARQMRIPPWIRDHFNDIVMLDIRICKLEEGGLKILREMPKLDELALRFEVVPKEPVIFSSQGFERLTCLIIDSRVPRITFQEGAMRRLSELKFQFQFYAGPPNKDPVGINHLRSLRCISFECNEDWYGGGDSPCIRPTIDVVRKEARELPSSVTLYVSGHEDEICWPQPSPTPPVEMGEGSSGVGEIHEDIQS